MSQMSKLIRDAIVLVIRFYQAALSPVFGGHCRFEPTCSNYFIQAVRARGAIHGTLLGLWRILRCNPFSRGGLDPVPLAPDDERERGGSTASGEKS